MGVALHTDARYSVKYVTERITRKLGRWMKSQNPEDQKILDEDLRILAEWSIKLDWHLHCNHQMFDFRFRDPATKKPYGFP
ncbi:predicted protein [Chaetomium globosum CBS 148.51]|uniref:Uncharacterized protein n=1 Tax=Chaetomium globosum (strain ATCC 6205 / CBS 148.51 / DSM 1962 / NBRC 6347 / NRRL 1970) TaxID=306901 RepID=Q2GPX0_CHAGB|nr:uncharacterized protein CHGG_09984 [Chaetomium globosum CBS 148.51]EAQ83580.1 predicted protein [Chaetomium globosum CBS 148.51]